MSSYAKGAIELLTTPVVLQYSASKLIDGCSLELVMQGRARQECLPAHLTAACRFRGIRRTNGKPAAPARQTPAAHLRRCGDRVAVCSSKQYPQYACQRDGEQSTQQSGELKACQ